MKKKMMMLCLSAVMVLSCSVSLFAKTTDNSSWQDILREKNRKVDASEKGGVLGIHVGKQVARIKIQQEKKQKMERDFVRNVTIIFGEEKGKQLQDDFHERYNKMQAAFAKNPLFKGYVVVMMDPGEWLYAGCFNAMMQFAEGKVKPYKVEYMNENILYLPFNFSIPQGIFSIHLDIDVQDKIIYASIA